MENGKTNPAAAPPTDRLFADALNRFVAARGRYEAAKVVLEHGQVAQAVAISELPEDQRADMAQLEAIADRLRIGAIGDEALELMTEAEEALAAFMAAPARSPHQLLRKMVAYFGAPWEAGDYRYRLMSDAGRLAGHTTPEWEAAKADFLAKRAAAAALPEESVEGEGDIIQADISAADHLIIAVPAPTVEAFLFKTGLAISRAANFTFPDEYRDALAEDWTRLFGADAAGATAIVMGEVGHEA
jgi:hypothetical protein